MDEFVSKNMGRNMDELKKSYKNGCNGCERSILKSGETLCVAYVYRLMELGYIDESDLKDVLKEIKGVELSLGIPARVCGISGGRRQKPSAYKMYQTNYRKKNGGQDWMVKSAEKWDKMGESEKSKWIKKAEKALEEWESRDVGVKKGSVKKGSVKKGVKKGSVKKGVKKGSVKKGVKKSSVKKRVKSVH